MTKRCALGFALLSALATLLCFASLTGCKSMAQDTNTGAPAQVYFALDGMNLVSVSYDGEGLAPGGGQTCCVGVPKTWRPGLTATVEWVVDPSPGRNPDGKRAPPMTNDKFQELGEWYRIHEAQYIHHRAVVPIPRYETIYGLYLVILPCGKAVPFFDWDEYNKKVYSLLQQPNHKHLIQQNFGATEQCQQP